MHDGTADVRRYTLLHPLVLSFFSRRLYGDVIGSWRGFGMAYLLMLLSLTTIPGVMRLSHSFSDFVAAEAPGIVVQIPDMTIREGRLLTDVAQPYYIRDGATGKPLIIIDTGGSVSALESTPAIVLVTGTQVIFRQSGGSHRILDLADFGDMTIDRRAVFGWLEAADRLFPFTLYPLTLAFSLVFHAAVALLLGTAAAALARVSGTGAGLKRMIRLAAVSMTPSVIIGAVFAALDMRLPYAVPLSIAVSAGYMLFGVKARPADTSALDSGKDSRL